MPGSKIDYQILRDIIAQIISSIEVTSTIPPTLCELGLPELDWTGLSKYNMVAHSLTAVNDEIVVTAAKKMVGAYPGKRGKLNVGQIQAIQDTIWIIEDGPGHQITNVVRFEIGEKLEGLPSFWGRSDGLQDFFTSAMIDVEEYQGVFAATDGFLYQRVLDISDLLPGLFPKKVPTKTDQDPRRVSMLGFLKLAKIAKWPDKRFVRFIERVVHPEVQRPEEIDVLVNHLGESLKKDGFEFYQASSLGGSPVYNVRRINHRVKGSPKYIIFAPTGTKPDIIITDTVNMDIQIVNDANDCIVYDQPPPLSDLTWEMLVDWWCKKNGLESNLDENRKRFGQRLLDSMDSDPERLLFSTYFKSFRSMLGGNLPALIPQVYLHYDPISKVKREKQVLFRQRMDFMLLLRNSTRLILEIDGQHHYADNEGKAVPQKYAEMVAEDRRIKLLGYEVFRFGGAEFVNEESATRIVTYFFTNLFEHYGITKGNS